MNPAISRNSGANRSVLSNMFGMLRSNFLNISGWLAPNSSTNAGRTLVSGEKRFQPVASHSRFRHALTTPETPQRKKD